ncbi:MAG: cupredoxin domain-containing protein [Thiogranum sp.]|nr:cupredoxin domain-containing protein [Thiogranum sp.]
MNRFLAGYSPLLLALTFGVFTGFFLISGVLQAAAPVRSVAVTMGDYRFSPDSISVQSGETIRLELVNTDSLTPHNFTLKAEAAGLNVDIDVSAGGTGILDITPLAPGTFEFYCNKKLPFMKSHRHRGMEGVLIVTPAGPD